MAHRTAHIDDLEFAQRPYREQDAPRHAASLTEALGLESSRATVWRYPPGARGRRHIEGAQEEVFAVIEGVVTLALDASGSRARQFRIDGTYEPTPDPMRFTARRLEARMHLPDLIGRIVRRDIDPGRVFDRTLPLDQAAEGYRAMDERRAIKTLLRV